LYGPLYEASSGQLDATVVRDVAVGRLDRLVATRVVVVVVVGMLVVVGPTMHCVVALSSFM
jgi:hypothetical protein